MEMLSTPKRQECTFEDSLNGFFTAPSPKKQEVTGSKFDHEIHETELRPGMSLSTIDLKAESEAVISYRFDKPIVGIGCILAGDIENRPIDRLDWNKPIRSSGGVSGITYHPVSEGKIYKASGKSVKILHLLLKPEILETLFSREMDMLPAQLKKVSEGESRQSFSLLSRMSPSLKSVAHQITSQTPHGVPKHIFQEGKALELLSLQIAALDAKGHGRKGTVPLTSIEREKIIELGSFLDENHDTPPALQALASRVNLSVNKLERGFREVYGMPVFAYIRESKMQKAKLLFLETSMNVSEVAWEVGYVNVSHFGAAFKKRFGILPKEFAKRVGIAC